MTERDTEATLGGQSGPRFKKGKGKSKSARRTLGAPPGVPTVPTQPEARQTLLLA